MSKVLVLKTQAQVNALHASFTHFLTYADNYFKINGHYPFNGYAIEDVMIVYFALPKCEALEVVKTENKKRGWLWKKLSR